MPLRLINQEMPVAAAAVTAMLTEQQDPSRTVDQATANQLRSQLAQAEQAHEQATATLRERYAAIAQGRADIDRARAAGNTQGLPELELKLKDALSLRNQQVESVRQAAAQVKQGQTSLVDALGTAAAFRHLSTNTPIVMLPVRLETRYVALDAANYELRVRIFPDAVHLDSHQPMLIEAEDADGRAYWQKRLAEGPEAESTRLVWHGLCQHYGEPRATWIVASLDPYGRGGRYEPGDGGTGAPPPPAVPIAPAGWMEPARMRALPDRWAIVGFRDQHRVLLRWTKPVPTWLQATPDLGEPGSELEGGADTQDLTSGIEWLTSFEAAEAVGMAARIPVTRLVARGMDRLLVFGISAARTNAAGELGGLLAAHAATGVDFITPGTATNNMEWERTEYRSQRHDHSASHARLLHNNPANTADSHAARLAARLRVDSSVFRCADHATERLESYVEALHDALWPATWGSVLTKQVEVNVAPSTLDLVRTQFTRHVRGLGLLPSLRLGRQPYGVLPVTSLELWKPAAPNPRSTMMVNLFRSIRNYLRRAYQVIPCMPNNRDAQSEMMGALAMEPSAHINEAHVIAPVPERIDAVTAALTEWWKVALNVLATGPIELNGFYADTQLANRRNGAAMDYFSIQRPLVSAQADKSVPLAANFIAALAALPEAQTVRDHGVAGAAERSLLYMLLRSAYLELANTSGDTSGFAARLTTLKDLPVTTLELLTAEIVDVCSYRADAWLSSVANERLPDSGAIYLGGFGWSEGLEPPGEPIADDGTVREDPDSAGFIHMPSPEQAKTAAVLYGGHLAHGDQGSAETLSLNLSSDRVRTARWLIDGQRQGQSLSALLGYRFERQLVENGLPQHIPDVRRAMPLSVGSTTSNGTDVSVANVVDGLALHTRWAANTLTEVLPAAVVTAVKDHVQPLDDALDALSDLLVAEGVHQATNGNATRAAAAFDSLADGDTLQADPEVIATPATGQQVAHRVMVVLPGGTAAAWPGDANRARAVAEPRLNRWASMFFGQPASIFFRAAFYLENVDGAVEREFRLSDFDLCPLDLVYLSGEHAADAPLVELIRLRLMQQGPDGQGGNMREVRVLPQRFDGLAENALSLEEALAVAWSVKRLLTESRALAAGDLEVSQNGTGSGPIEGSSLTELKDRAAATRQMIGAVRDAYAAGATLATWWRASVLTGPVDPQLPDGRTGILSTLEKRADDADAVSDSDAGRAVLARVAALLGKEFRVLPQIRAANPNTLQNSLGDPAALLENDFTRPSRWLHDYARVRSGCETLDLLLTLARALKRIVPIVVGQYPALPGQVWIGDRIAANGIVPRLSMLIHTPFAVSATGDFSGLLVDSWSEVIPSPRTTTGLTFNYDEPKAQAPQTMLLAVAPDLTRGWDFQSLEATLLETFEMIKLRGITADGLSNSDYPAGYLEFYRPALHLPGNQKQELEAGGVGA